MIYHCCNLDRLEAVRAHPSLNAIASVEVLDRQAPPDSPRQRTLLVRLLRAPDPTAVQLSPANVRIEGGERIRDVGVEWAALADTLPEDRLSDAELALLSAIDAPDRVLVLRTDSSGDDSTYALRLIGGESSLTPPEGFDPVLSRLEFSFKVECPSEFDCLSEPVCPTEPRQEPAIDYLAKDYASFRRLMLDRMRRLVPDWRERSPADAGIVLVELIAHVADQLSYHQDAVATEAYLGTARRRVSLRRHARLVDYPIDDGCNARAWVHVAVRGSGIELPKQTELLSRVGGLPTRLAGSGALQDALQQRPVVFETMHDVRLHEAHNRIDFYTWGQRDCCLTKGATRATLRGQLADLRPCDVLLLEEVRGPETGRAEDADPARRHLVRLVEVLGNTAPLIDPLTDTAVTEVRWHDDDRLPFPLCISSDAAEAASVARGNMVLADHGRRISGESLGIVPESHLDRAAAPSAGGCGPDERERIPPRYRPRLQERPLTHAAPSPYPEDPEGPECGSDIATGVASAAASMRWDQAAVMPCIEWLGPRASGAEDEWQLRRDLLASRGNERHFVVEMEDDGVAWLRFGTGDSDGPGLGGHGRRPSPGTELQATYRVGNGPAGNVGAEALAHVVSDDDAVLAIRNPLPASGGRAPESMEQIRIRAPEAFRTQRRAVTPEDYAAAAEGHPEVQRAAATLRWTGSWHTVFITVDRLGGLSVDPDFEAALRAHLEPFRMAGQDLEVDGPKFVPLELALTICVQREHLRGDVKGRVLALLSSRDLPDGRRGLFHPDNFSFGQSVHRSAIAATVQAVPGVDSVQVTAFRRASERWNQQVPAALSMGRLEIARLDNDPTFPGRGVVRVTALGGR
jgi:hypothetical protein